MDWKLFSLIYTRKVAERLKESRVFPFRRWKVFRRGIEKLISERGARTEGRLTGKLRGWNSLPSYQPDADLFPPHVAATSSFLG